MNEKEAIKQLKQWISVIDLKKKSNIIPNTDDIQAIETVLNLLEKKDKETEYWKNGFERKLESNRKNIIEIIKKDKIIDLMAEDKYENINMIQMANIGKEVNYDPIKLFSGIPDEESIKIIKQYFERKVENGN